MAVTIALSNQKGGVGKTTSAYVIATALKEMGYRVLAVDMDPQGNLSFSLGADTESATIYDVLKGELKPRYAVQKSTLVDIIPSNILLSSIELEFTGVRREFLLTEALGSLKGLYDYILIDSPPALGILTVNAFTAADYVLVPMLSDIFSLQGITQLEETIRRVRNYCNPDIRILGVFLTKHNPRTRFSKEVEGTLRMVAEDLQMPVLETFIRESVALREAQSLQCSVLEYAPDCNAVRDYKSLIQELMQRGLKANG
ncbi:ParA family protein [Enterocloster aldenensis]|uniref:ParA family protein n=1 Tax=Enterocloster aldenensis TaxID=358742 RepID=UPI000E42013A|nr:ParA family protein [Enterocloster aldenensis]